MLQSQRPTSVSMKSQNDGSEQTHEIVKFNCCNALVYTRDDFLCDGSSIDMFRIQSITQPRYSGSDLVELDAFFTSVSLIHEHDCGSM